MNIQQFPPQQSQQPPSYGAPTPAMPPVSGTQPLAAIDSSAKPAAIALFVIAGLTLIGLVSGNWFTMGRHGIGLFDAFGHRVPADVQLAAILTLLGGVAAIGLQIHAGAVLMNGAAHRVRVAGTNIALGIAAAGALLFLLRVGIESHASVGWSGIVSVLGLAAGLVVMLVMVRPLASVGAPASFPVMAAPGGTPMPAGMPMPAGAAAAAAKPYPLVLQDGMTRYYGHVFLRANRLYFICTKEGGALMVALGTGLGGLLGNALMEAAVGGPGAAPTTVLDDATLMQAVQQHKGSLVMEAQQITEIKQTWAWRLIRWNGKKFGLPRGLGRELKPAIGAWARYHGVKTTGF